MTHDPLPVPPHYDPATVGQVWRVPYEERARQADGWRRSLGILPAAADRRRLCLLAVDVQNTFCIPGFELFVGGRTGAAAVDDNRRLCEFVYRNLDLITEICPTLDTHQPQQIFHAVFLVDDQGRHPAPYTLVTAADVEQGRWRFNPAIAAGLGLESAYVQRHLEHYTRALAGGGKYALTIWPYHALLGGIGHALVSAFEEAAFFHGQVRGTQPKFQQKGSQPLTEHYSVLGPEVLTGPDGAAIAARNLALIDSLLEFDAIVIAGQAKSHCVAWTVQDLLDAIHGRDASLVQRVYLLEDCSSPVVVPGVIDYSDEAGAAYQKFSAAGMRVVRSVDPIATWPGMA